MPSNYYINYVYFARSLIYSIIQGTSFFFNKNKRHMLLILAVYHRFFRGGNFNKILPLNLKLIFLCRQSSGSQKPLQGNNYLQSWENKLKSECPSETGNIHSEKFFLKDPGKSPSTELFSFSSKYCGSKIH